MSDLCGKVALVTGASRGIGREIALTLSSQGATVVINYSGSKEKAEEVLETIKANKKEAAIYQCNVSDPDAVQAMMQYVVDTYGKIDILVNNAGITKDNLLMKMSEDEFNQVMDVNLKGTFHTCKSVIRQMIRQRSGRIVNMASIVGITGNAGQVNYSASKAGIIGLTKSLAKEVASRNITVNAVAPGFIKTDMTSELPTKVVDEMLNAIPMKRQGLPEDIANAVSFLVSEESGYITGQVLEVNGGMNM